MIPRLAAVWVRGVLARAPRSGLVGLALLGVLVVVALLSPLRGYPVGADVNPAIASLGPSGAHWLGTDHLGRDVFWRMMLASRAFVWPGLLSCAVTAALGIPIGALAGWGTGFVAAALRTAIAAVASVPRLVWVLLGCAIYGNGAVQLALAAGLGAFPSLAEGVRERIERLRIDELVLADRAHGLSDARILGVHLVLLACGRAIARNLLAAFGAFVGLECTLSYLGQFGVQEPTPSWGNQLAFDWGRTQPWSFVAPALAIWATMAAVSAAGRIFAEPDDG